MSPSLRPGKRVGPYIVVRKIGSGGNADVYEGTTTEESGASALKVLRSRRTESEPYQRFRQEVVKHRELSQRGERGVLPVLAFNLPETPNADDRPWIAMPVAVPIEDALGAAPALEDVVEAVATIADTLARLHAGRISHRDIKPSNLYQYENEWVISDFGLVNIPGGEPLTVGAKALGARHFIAPEMIMRPDIQDGRPADVFSLGKTLWCLLTGQRVPPPGEHRKEFQAKSIGEWGVAHPRAFYLDRLIEQTSHEIPEERPPMESVARTLTDWANPRQGIRMRSVFDVRDVTGEIADILATDQARKNQHQTHRAEAEELAQRFGRECLASLATRLNEAGVPHSGIVEDFTGISEVLAAHADMIPGTDRVAAHRSLAVERNTGRDQRYAFFRSGVGVALATNQTVLLAATHTVRHNGVNEIIWKDVSEVVMLGSADLDNEIDRLAAGFIEATPSALNRLREIIHG
jgi:hypothetical protein